MVLYDTMTILLRLVIFSCKSAFGSIIGNQSSTGFSVVDMHIYMQAAAVQILGMSGYHDQSSDRGVSVFGYKSNQSTARTGLKNNCKCSR